MNKLKQRLQKHKYFRAIAKELKTLLAEGDETELIWYVQQTVHKSFENGVIYGGKLATQSPTGDELLKDLKSKSKR